MPWLSSKETLSQGMGCWRCWSSDALEMPPAAGGLTNAVNTKGNLARQFSVCCRRRAGSRQYGKAAATPPTPSPPGMH